jgi:hypothetical protein
MACGRAAGAIEALAVELPERWGVEILDAHPGPEAGDYRAQHRQDRIWDAFIASIVVRDRSAFTDRTAELINDALSRRPSWILDALISVAPDPTHPFSAERQHRFLSKIPMAADEVAERLEREPAGKEARSDLGAEPRAVGGVGVHG